MQHRLPRFYGEPPYISYIVLNEEPQGDIDILLNGTLHEMKLALQQW